MDTNTRKLYTVQQMAEACGVSDGLIYQGIAKKEIETASDELLVELGLDPAIIRKPKRWIPHEEVQKFLQKYRKTSNDVFKNPKNSDQNSIPKISAYGLSQHEKLNLKKSAYGSQNNQHTGTSTQNNDDTGVLNSQHMDDDVIIEDYSYTEPTVLISNEVTEEG